MGMGILTLAFFAFVGIGLVLYFVTVYNSRVLLVMLLGLVPSALAQGPPPGTAAAEIAEIKKLEFMVGRWQGEGWMEGPGGRTPFRGGEHVQSKLGGRILLVEGLFKGATPSGEEITVHETLAVISYDTQAKTYRLRTYVARGGTGDHQLKLTGDRAWEWGFTAGPATIRFTMKLTEAGEWFEIGERSTDGQTWHQFFEMKLKKE